MIRHCKGFSLIEVLVAFVILSLSLGVLLQIFSGGLNRIGVSKQYARAVSIAESRLASAGIATPIVEGETEGRDDAGYSWATSITRYEDGEAPLGTDAGVLRLYRVDVTVGWSEGAAGRRSLQLSTLRLGDGT